MRKGWAVQGESKYYGSQAVYAWVVGLWKKWITNKRDRSLFPPPPPSDSIPSQENYKNVAEAKYYNSGFIFFIQIAHNRCVGS